MTLAGIAILRATPTHAILALFSASNTKSKAILQLFKKQKNKFETTH